MISATTTRIAERIKDQRDAARKLAALQQAAQQQIAAAQAEVVRLGGALDELCALWLPEGMSFEQAWKDDHDGIRSLVEGGGK